jgi:hypothetical protein
LGIPDFGKSVASSNYHQQSNATQKLSLFYKRGGIKEDKANFVKLVKTLKARMSKRNKMVTAALGATSTYIREAYAPMKDLCE